MAVEQCPTSKANIETMHTDACGAQHRLEVGVVGSMQLQSNYII